MKREQNIEIISAFSAMFYVLWIILMIMNWWRIVLEKWLVNIRRETLFLAIVRNSYHLKFPTCRKQDSNLRRIRIQALLNEDMQ